MTDSGFAPRDVRFPDAVGEVLAVRSFRVTGDGLLRGVSVPQTWLAGTNVAVCRLRHRGADPDCQCGFYAYGQARWRPSWLRPDDRASDVLVAGVVACSGRVVVGEHGVRAEQARIVALTVPEGRQGRDGSLERHYPDARLFCDEQAMVTAVSPTPMAEYREPVVEFEFPRRRWWAQARSWLAGGVGGGPTWGTHQAGTWGQGFPPLGALLPPADYLDLRVGARAREFSEYDAVVTSVPGSTPPGVAVWVARPR